MSRIRISKSRLAAAVVLIAILVVGILFPVSGSNAKYTTQTTLRGSVSYMLDNSLATGFTLTGADNNTYPLIPGTEIAPVASVTVTGRTETPAYLYIEVVGDLPAGLKISENWTPLTDGTGPVTGPNGGKLYVYGNGTLAIDITAAPVFADSTLSDEPANAGSEIKIYPFLVEQIGNDGAATAFGRRAEADVTCLEPAPLTVKFDTVSLTAVANGDYAVQNTGNIDAYIRAKVVLNRVDEAGNIEADGEPLLKEGVTELTVDADHWTKVGDYLYYNGRVAPEGLTTAPLDPTEVAEGVTVTVIAEAIQTEGGAAADAWGVIWNGTTWTTP